MTENALKLIEYTYQQIYLCCYEVGNKYFFCPWLSLFCVQRYKLRKKNQRVNDGRKIETKCFTNHTGLDRKFYGKSRILNSIG